MEVPADECASQKVVVAHSVAERVHFDGSCLVARKGEASSTVDRRVHRRVGCRGRRSAGARAHRHCLASLARRPRLRTIAAPDVHRAIATLHSFRFFGRAFLPGVVDPDLPAQFTGFAAYGDFGTGLQVLLALLAFRVRPLFWCSSRRSTS